MARSYQVCTRCIMDTTDPGIQFDENGVCNYCRMHDELAPKILLPEADRQARLSRLVKEIKAKGRGKAYDCIIGVSGGVDSTYVAYLVKQLGLRPLAVHLDNGWDSELSVSNIEKVLKTLNIDLYTVVLDWEEFKDLQLAFLRASVPDAEVPTDHAIVTVLYQAAVRQGVSYILMGNNYVSEAFMPVSWAYGHHDWQYIRGVHRRFGTGKLKSFPHRGFFDRFLYYPFIKRIQAVSILDYVGYNKQAAMQILDAELGWRPYGGKHYESIYTRFFQGYILPTKFNIDKRKSHLSALIRAGHISREQALAELEHPPYAGYMLEEDMEYVLKKFGLTAIEFEQIMSLPLKTYRDYPTSRPLMDMVKRWGVARLARKLGLLERV